MEEDRFKNFTPLHAMYLKQVFDIMPAPGKASLLCLVPQNRPYSNEVMEYAIDLVDYYIGTHSMVKYVYGDKKHQWYLASRNQSAEAKLNRLVELMIYNNNKNALLKNLNKYFTASFIRNKSGDLMACFIPTHPKESKSLKEAQSKLNEKKQQELALYFGWKKSKRNYFWSANIGICARLMRDMRLLKKLPNQKVFQDKESLNSRSRL